MLTRLSIRNIVLIEALDLDFARGLGVPCRRAIQALARGHRRSRSAARRAASRQR